jgi:hypothetical protein
MTEEQRMKALIERIVKAITNPDISIRQKIIYAGNVCNCLILVGDKWNISPEEVFDIAEKEEAENPPLFEPEDRESLTKNQKIFWDFILEMEPFDDPI